MKPMHFKAPSHKHANLTPLPLFLPNIQFYREGSSINPLPPPISKYMLSKARDKSLWSRVTRSASSGSLLVYSNGAIYSVSYATTQTYGVTVDEMFSDIFVKNYFSSLNKDAALM